MWAADSGVMRAAIPLRCGPHFLFHRNRGPHGVIAAHIEWNHRPTSTGIRIPCAFRLARLPSGCHYTPEQFEADLVAFLKSGRYHGNPRNLVGAMAGLPLLNWKQIGRA